MIYCGSFILSKEKGVSKQSLKASEVNGVKSVPKTGT